MRIFFQSFAYLDFQMVGVWIQKRQRGGVGRQHEHDLFEDHLERLPERDERSLAILDQMKEDEAKHAQMAEEAGASDLPKPIQGAMAFTAGIMKTLAYRI